MKSSNTRSMLPSRPMRTPSILRLRQRRRVAAVLFGVVGIAAFGCVRVGTFKEVSEKNQQLEERIVQLERSNSSLDSERVALIAQVDDLSSQRESLGREVDLLKKERLRLDQELSESRHELDARSYEIGSLRTTYEALVGDLEGEIAAGEIEIQQLKEGVEVSVSDDVLFKSGQAVLNETGREVLERLAAQLAAATGRVEVEGHTDDRAISGALSRRFPSNWELAAARATTVVRLFEEQGVAGGRLYAVSRGPYDPLVSNETEEGRSVNRRIEIRLLPALSGAGEEGLGSGSLGGAGARRSGS